MPRHIEITERRISAEDMSTLIRWRNDESFRKLCARRKNIVDESQFYRELDRDFEIDRCEQVIITVDGTEIGTAFAYNYSSVGNTVYFTIYIDHEHRWHAYGVIAAAKFLTRIFHERGLYKIYFEIVSYNAPVIRLMQHLKIKQEAQLEQHIYFKDSRYDLLIYAVYFYDVNRIIERLQRLGARFGVPNLVAVKLPLC